MRTRSLVFGSLAFFVIAAAALLVPWHLADMEMGGGGDMTGCPFMTMATLCKMSVADHISQWQFIFYGFHRNSFFLFFYVLAALIILVWHDVIPIDQSNFRKKVYCAKNIEYKLFDYVKEAFSRGLLNPKLYSALS